MSRAWSLALPVVTVLVVLYAMFVAGAPRAITFARVYGGPSEGLSRLSLRAEVLERAAEREEPFWDGALKATARARGLPKVEVGVARAQGGVADFELSFPHAVRGPVDLELSSASGRRLARGFFALDAERWGSRAGRRGGWIRGRDAGGLVVSMAPERGAFVVGSLDSLLLRVENSRNAVAGARLEVTAEGARVVAPPDLRSDARGRAVVTLQAFDLNPTVRVEAKGVDGRSGVLDSGVPVVPGGLHCGKSGAALRVESATPRADFFYSLVTSSARVLGGRAALVANDQGGFEALLTLPEGPRPAWLVLSSEVDENSVATIGWPLDTSSEPARTFDVPDVLLLDGAPAAFAREQARRSRVRWLTAAFIALAFALTVVLLVVRVRAADRTIALHLRTDLEAADAAKIAPRALLPLCVALLALGLGFVLLGLIVAARSR